MGHDLTWAFNNDATCTEDGTETGKCSRCDYTENRVKENSKLEHPYSEWKIITAPTYYSTGIKERTCSMCNKVESEIVPKVPLEISTDIIDGAVSGISFSKQLEVSVPDLSEGIWSILSGSLPAGLDLTLDGCIIGTPSETGISTFMLSVESRGERATKSFTMSVASKMCNVSFNPNGGSVSESHRMIAQGSTIGELPIAENPGQVFGGWFTSITDGLKIDPNYTVSSDVTFYARWGESSDVEFGDATTQFNIQVNGDRTNYDNNPYTLYSRCSNGSSSNLVFQTGIASQDGTSNMTASNKKITLYLKVTNNGSAGKFDIGFDCDSYVNGDDTVAVVRVANGVKLGGFTVTVPYTHTAWVGNYSDRTEHRYDDSTIGATSEPEDSGYALTIRDVFINSGSYAILEVVFQLD